MKYSLLAPEWLILTYAGKEQSRNPSKHTDDGKCDYELRCKGHTI